MKPSISEKNESTPTPTPASVSTSSHPTIITNFSWTMSQPTPDSFSKNGTPVISGTGATPGHLLKLYLKPNCSGGSVAFAIIKGDGSFSFSSFTLTEQQKYTFYFQSEYQGKQEECQSTKLSYTLDTTAPLAVSSFSMSSPSDNSISNDQTPVISGSGAEPQATVKIYSDVGCAGTPQGTGVVSANGSFTISAFTLPTEKSYSFYYTISDLAGNSRSCSPTQMNYTLDRTAPVLSLTSGLSGVFSTSSQTLSFTATDSVGVTQQCVSSNSNCSGCQWEAFTGSKTLSFSTPWEKKYSSVQVRDAAGNTSSCINSEGYYETLTVQFRHGNSLPEEHRTWKTWVEKEVVCTDQKPDSNIPNCIHMASNLAFHYLDSDQCADFTAEDNLGVFDWSCHYKSGGGITFFGTLRPKKGLGNLVQWNNEIDPYSYEPKMDSVTWKDFGVTLKQKGTPILGRAPRPFWSDALIPVQNRSAVMTINEPGTYILVNTAAEVEPIKINTSNVALATLSGIRPKFDVKPGECDLDGSPTSCFIDVNSGLRNIYLEGSFEPKDELSQIPYGVIFDNITYGRIHNLKVTTLGNGDGLLLRKPQNLIITGLTSTFNKNGIYIDSETTGLRVSNSMFSNNLSSGIFSKGKISVSESSFLSNHFGLQVEEQSILSSLTLAFSEKSSIETMGNMNTFYNVLSLDNTKSFQIDGDKNDFNHIAFNSTLTLTSNAKNNTFLGTFWESSGGKNCDIAGADLGVEDQTCNKNGTSNINDFNTSVLFTDTFLGKITDEVNEQGQSSSVSTITDPLSWDSIFNGFVKSGPSVGPCTTGPCEVYSLRTSEKSPTLKALNNPMSADQDCDAFFDETLTDTSYSGVFYFNKLSEVVGDGIGNDNGLCEESEDCKIIQNFGSDIGSGILGSCAGLGGRGGTKLPRSIIGFSAVD